MNMNKLSKRILGVGLGITLCAAGLSGCGGAEESGHDHGTVEQVTSERPEYPDVKALDYITLPENYEHMELTVTPKIEDITPEMIDERILENVSPESLDSGEVQMGDTVVIDLHGTIDDEPFDGGDAEDYSLTIGSGAFIEGFEEQLVGMKLNKDHPKEKTIRVVFPDDYSNIDLASQVAVFKVKLKDIKRRPQAKDLTEDQIKAASGGDSKTLKEFREATKKALRQEYDDRYSNEVHQAILDWLKENSKAKEFPEELRSWYYDSVFAVYDDYAKSYDISLEEVFASNGLSGVKDKDSFVKYASETVEEELLTEILPQAVAEDLKISCTDQEYQEYVENMMAARGYTGEFADFEKIFTKSCLKHWTIIDNVYERLESSIVAVPATKTDDLTGNPEAVLDEDGNLVPDDQVSENNSSEISSEGSGIVSENNLENNNITTDVVED